MAGKTRLPTLTKPLAASRITAPTGVEKRVLKTDDVYAMVKKIPRGKVATYGQIAALIGMPRHSRHVGNALSNMPPKVKIPWQRVVNSAGRISLRLAHWESGSEQLQRILLEDEGVDFDASGRVDLKRFRWEPTKVKE